MSASICERPEWATLVNEYDAPHKISLVREDIEQFLASLTSEHVDELVDVVRAGGVDEALAHEVLVVLAHRFDARFRPPRVSAWQDLVTGQVEGQWRHAPVAGPSGGTIDQAFRMPGELRLPIASGGTLLVGPGPVRCTVIFAPIVTPRPDQDRSDGLSVRIRLGDDTGRIFEVSAALPANSLWSWFHEDSWSPLSLPHSHALVTGLRCCDDSRKTFFSIGRIGGISYPREDACKYTFYVLDVRAVRWGDDRTRLCFVIHPHLGRLGVTSPCWLFAERLPYDMLVSDWGDTYSRWQPVLDATEARGEPQASVRLAVER